MSHAAPPAHHGYPTPPKKSYAGCFVALAIVGALGLVVLIAIGIGLYKVAQDPDAQKAMKAVGEAAKLAEQARKAPGAKEVRAAGCKEALVLDSSKIAEVMAAFDDAGVTEEEVAAASPPPQVQCQVGAFGAAPECDTLARVYVDAAHPSDRFIVTVVRQGGSEPICSSFYTRNGTRTETIR